MIDPLLSSMAIVRGRVLNPAGLVVSARCMFVPVPMAVRAHHDAVRVVHPGAGFHPGVTALMCGVSPTAPSWFFHFLRQLPRFPAVRFSIGCIMRNEGEANIVLCENGATA
jgi:hypothetical protein